jgi:hypothetical protein
VKSAIVFSLDGGRLALSRLRIFGRFRPVRIVRKRSGAFRYQSAGRGGRQIALQVGLGADRSYRRSQDLIGTNQCVA